MVGTQVFFCPQQASGMEMPDAWASLDCNTHDRVGSEKGKELTVPTAQIGGVERFHDLVSKFPWVAAEADGWDPKRSSSKFQETAMEMREIWTHMECISCQ